MILSIIYSNDCLSVSAMLLQSCCNTLRSDENLKKIALSVFLLFFAFIPSVFAHTSLSSSVPEDGETIQEEVEHVTLLFNTSIETMSTLKVTDEMGMEVPLEEITVDDKEMKGILESPLTTGNYQVDWKIVGQDGHPIEGEYSFSIGKSETEVEEPKVSMESPSDNVVEDLPEEKILRENNPGSTATNMMIAVACILIAVIAGVVMWLFRRGGK